MHLQLSIFLFHHLLQFLFPVRPFFFYNAEHGGMPGAAVAIYHVVAQGAFVGGTYTFYSTLRTFVEMGCF